MFSLKKLWQKYKIAFSYNKTDANKVSFATNRQDFVSKTKPTNYHQDKTTEFCSYKEILWNYKPYPSRGKHPPPYEYLYDVKNAKELKTRITQWKQLYEATQETYLEQYKN